VTGQPAVGVTVQRTCRGAGTLTPTTDARGKFEFDGVGGSPCSLGVVIGGTTVPLATTIQIGPQPIEVEALLNLAPGGAPGATLGSTASDDGGGSSGSGQHGSS
jgi:hypothetical protein